MAVRNSIASVFATANAEALEPHLRALIADVLASQPPAAPDAALVERIEALEAENARLKKKLDMAMGAIQASTAQLMAARRDVGEASKLARQAMQAATTATATAESAAEGLTELEQKLG